MLISRRSSPGTLRVLTSGRALTVAFFVVLLLSLGPLVGVDRALNHPWQETWPQVQPVMDVVVRLGQRAVCLPILFAVAVFAARRSRSWEPLVVSFAGALALNLVVGIMKLLTARDHPMTGDPGFFERGIMFPSGHAANAIMIYGLATYLARYFDSRRKLLARLLLLLTWVAAFAMVVTGLYFQWHWFTDLLAGFLIGGVMLRASIYVHRWLRGRLARARTGQVPAGNRRVAPTPGSDPRPRADRDARARP